MLTIIEIKAREDGGHGLQSQSHRTECWLEGWVERLPGRGREKEGRRQKLGRLLLKLFEWIRRELYADHHRN